MPSPQDLFHSNMQEADTLSGVYDYLTAQVIGPVSFDDLLRFKLAYTVSAFDKLIHDLVLLGMVETYLGRKAPTPKYLNEAISLGNMQALSLASTPPASVVFEGIVRAKFKILSFQDPDKVADALSYVWSETQKWQRIAAILGDTDENVRRRLKLIVARRNSVVHEADLDPLTHAKLPITKQVAGDAHAFILAVGDAICSLVV